MKWLIIFGIIVATILALGHFFAKKSVRSEIIINAPVEKIWAVMTDSQSYPEWNPTMQLKGGTNSTNGIAAEGEKVAYQFTDANGQQSTITATVKQKIPNQLLHQSGGIPTVITYENYWRLEPIDGNTTKVSIQEDYAGVYVWFWNTDSTEKAYELMNQALAERASH